MLQRIIGRICVSRGYAGKLVSMPLAQQDRFAEFSGCFTALIYTRYKPLAWHSSHHSSTNKHSFTAVRVPCISGSSKIIIHHEGFALKGAHHA